MGTFFRAIEAGSSPSNSQRELDVLTEAAYDTGTMFAAVSSLTGRDDLTPEAAIVEALKKRSFISAEEFDRNADKDENAAR
jgi:uncharacterized protein YutE (UPF0331/DUF86 family)